MAILRRIGKIYKKRSTNNLLLNWHINKNVERLNFNMILSFFFLFLDENSIINSLSYLVVKHECDWGGLFGQAEGSWSACLGLI